MVTYIKSDLEFILAQIKIAEAHSAGQPLLGPGGLVPAYNISWGLRTVDGTYNNLLPGREEWGAADNEFPELLPPAYRPATVVDMNGGAPGGLTAASYAPSNDPNNIVVDPALRTISNLIVDQTPGNPAALLTAMQRAGVVDAEDQMTRLAEITAEYQPLAPLFKAAADTHRADTSAQQTLALAQQAFDQNPTPENQSALAVATANAAATQAASDAAEAALEAARGPFDALLEASGIEMDGHNVKLPNTAPDEGLSAPFNSWFTLFGQFFDHGLDLVAKGGSGTVFVPLQPDDPLYDPNSSTNFMVLTRATVQPGPDNTMGTADDIRPVNTTTSFVDQNQTYTSHPSHQVFLREYALVNGRPEATGRLLDGENGGLPTWADVKAQAREILGIDLTDYHVGNLPLLATDPYGNFIPNPATGFPQVVMMGPPQTLASGTPAAPLSLVNVQPDGSAVHLAARTGHAFLDDIAHTAVPVGKLADGDVEIGLGNFDPDQFYDSELLDAHFVTGDGRGNENIGLTAVHHVFHAEHNRLLQHTKDTVLATGDLAFINEWLAVDIATLPTTPAQITALQWDGERLFQAAKFGTEMQYQHLVFEEFARKVQPNVNVFVVPDGYDVTIDPSIVAEFAHVVYRFGHSMLTESIDRYDPSFNSDHIGLIEGFLNPVEFANSGTAEETAGAIIRGMTRQVGNQIDEFVTSALRNNLLGLPLDLATINLARGRDTGVPSLNAARREFYEMTNNAAELKPYDNWVDFAGNLKNEASVINFIAAYGTHSLITSQTTIEDRRDAALTIITGVSVGGLTVPADAVDFLNGTGAWASVNGITTTGLDNIDLWIGGLAEKIMPFGGMLGSTFNFVFETQMEKLQNGDRFYYLQRLDGLHLFGEMENNSFAAMIMRNTDATHLPSDVFSSPGLILEIDRTKQYNPGLGETAGLDGILLDDPNTPIDESADNLGNDPVGSSLLTKLVVRDNPLTPGVDTNYLRYTGDEHVVLGGTAANDVIIASIGDDTVYGDGGKDNIEGGLGNDILNGGDGDDIIRDMGGDDNIKAGAGNDVVHAGPGLDLVLGGSGQDYIFLGTDMGSEVFAGEGNDFIYGNKNAERILGNEGDDWIETGTFDGAPGDNFDEIFARDGIDGHDVFLGDGGFDEFIGEGGDDIMVGSAGRGKMVGMSGWDWVTYKDNIFAVDADLSRGIVFDENPTPPPNAALDGFEAIEGVSGSRFNDILSGSNITAAERLPAAQGGSEGYTGSRLTKEGVQRITGLNEVLGIGLTALAALPANTVVYDAGDIILGGDGSDRIRGLGGDDILDGDKWLDVRIGVFDLTTGALIKSVASMTELANDMFNGVYNPAQLRIVREIKTDSTAGDVDVAVFQGARGEYAFSTTADGQLVVTHAVEDSLDGTDRLRNIERVEFSDGAALNIIVGTPNSDVLNGTPNDDLMLGLGGGDVLNGGAGNDILVGGANGPSGSYADNFNTAAYTNNTGTASFTDAWTESGDVTTGNVVTGGQIRIAGSQLTFGDNDNDPGNGGAQIQRSLNLAGATTASISYDYAENGFDAGEIVTVQFSANGTTFTTLQTINNNSGSGTFTAQLTGPFTANAIIRFVVSGTNNNSAQDTVGINNLTISFSSADVLNGGLGDDTYSFGLGDGNDIINEPVNATSGGAADRISILAPVDTVSGLGLLTELNVTDNNTGTATGDLVVTYGMLDGATPVTQTVTVTGHFTGATAQTGVERINFNGATYAGHLLGSDDYLISRADPAGTPRAVDLSASTANNLIAGESGNDLLTGGLGNDLLFGGAGDNQLVGGAGIDLLVGGGGAGDDDLLDGGADADTMVGLAGNDTYVVDDAADLVVEAAGQGTDTVQTALAALTLAANVENLVYTGVDADQFAGTGNALNNTITGGDLADTLVGLDGNDTLDGGLGADNLQGGVGNDTYIVDDAGDVVSEAGGLATDIDTVQSAVTYTLAAGLENLVLTGGDINGTGNAANNAIQGSGGVNQLFGGAGTDTIDGGDGADLIDGGIGNDTLNGGTGGDADVIVGGEGNDTIDVGNGNDLIRYTAANFGNDVVNNFDAAGGSAATQDLIDLRALGITAATFAGRVTIEDVIDPGTDDTRVTVRDAGGAVMGTIYIEEVDGNDVTITDFLLATAGNVINGTAAGTTINGTAGADTINALGGNDTVNAGAGDDVITGGLGNDTTNGDAGDDRFVWNANASGDTDGRDIVNGGTESFGGDIFTVTGNASAETYTVYTRAAWDALPGNNIASLNAATEIVITRNGTNNASIIAELREIEEIRINGVDPSGSGTVAGDTFNVVGDFSATSLWLNTLTFTGTGADDRIDISSLDSSHRIVYEANGGSDILVGAVRPQDVVSGDVETVAPVPTDDVILATTEADVMTGRGGADTFVFASLDVVATGVNRRDVVTDFESGEDRIDLSGIDASSVNAADRLDNDAFASIQAGGAFSGAGQLRYRTETVDGKTMTVIDGNTDNDQAAEFEIALLGEHTLLLSDFLL